MITNDLHYLHSFDAFGADSSSVDEGDILKFSVHFTKQIFRNDEVKKVISDYKVTFDIFLAREKLTVYDGKNRDFVSKRLTCTWNSR